MDLNTITAVVRPQGRDALPPWQDGDAWLAGGTWLFSEPQPHLNRLIDLAGLRWPAIEVDEHGLRIAATCTIAALEAAVLPVEWIAAPLIGQCCRAFLASFKIWNTATVGGNICMSLPAGPMISLASALDGIGTVWSRDGGERRIAIVDFVTGSKSNALTPGEILRCIDLPAAGLAAAHRVPADVADATRTVRGARDRHAVARRRCVHAHRHGRNEAADQTLVCQPAGPASAARSHRASNLSDALSR